MGCCNLLLEENKLSVWVHNKTIQKAIESFRVTDEHKDYLRTLKRIEPHRLVALVLEDLQRYPQSAISEIHQRIGGEIHPKQVKRALEDLIERGAVRFEGNNRWRRYWAIP